MRVVNFTSLDTSDLSRLVEGALGRQEAAVRPPFFLVSTAPSWVEATSCKDIVRALRPYHMQIYEPCLWASPLDAVGKIEEVGVEITDLAVHTIKTAILGAIPWSARSGRGPDSPGWELSVRYRQDRYGFWEDRWGDVSDHAAYLSQFQAVLTQVAEVQAAIEALRRARLLRRAAVIQGDADRIWADAQKKLKKVEMKLVPP